MCALLENYLPPESLGEDDMDPNQILQKDWGNIVTTANSVRNSLQQKQADFKFGLVDGINKLKIDVIKFKQDFDQNGPMVKGIEPKEALNRLKQFSEEYSIRKRKYDTYFAGETLYGLPHQQYAELDDIQKKIELLEKLYNLYSKVKDTVGKWKDFQWTDVGDEIEKMTDSIEIFAKDCTRLPGSLKSWDAFKELRTEIDSMTEIIPLIEQLSKPTIKDRHWDEIIELSKTEIDYQSETFNLDMLMKAPLLQFKEDIEDITESADKQAKLEKQLNNEISMYWETAEFEVKHFGNGKQITEPAVLGGNIQDIQERFENDIMQLNQMNAMRYVKPFKA
jgi:dynein heavy chain